MQIEKEILLQAENVNKVAMLHKECAKPEKGAVYEMLHLDMVTTGDVYLMDQISQE